MTPATLAALAGSMLCAQAGVSPAPSIPEQEIKPSQHGALLRDAETQRVRKPGFWVADERSGALRVLGQIEFRYLASLRDDLPAAAEDFAHGFEHTRVRAGLQGHIADPSLTYFIWTAFGASGDAFLLDAWVKKTFDNGVFVQAGQFKLPITREWLVSETRQQFVERSLVDARFAAIYGQGVQAGWLGEDARVYASFTDGLRSFNRSLKGTQYAVSGRVEAKAFGNWADYSEFESQREDGPLLVFGLGGHVQDGGVIGDGATVGFGSPDIYSNDTRITQWTADVNWGVGGANLFAAVISNREQRGAQGPAPLQTFHQLGVVVQGGVFVTDNTEVIARYEWGDLDGEASALAGAGGDAGETLSVLTVGVNQFLAGHAVKLTVDGGYGFEGVDAAWRGGGRGYLPDASGGGGQFVLRAQVNVLF
ncbi:MAG: porin [Planctomycetota bacterium]